MIAAQQNIYDREIFYRITALWVICEAFAGGIMHGIKIPFSGMMVSSLAVFCIILLARYAPQAAAILKATFIVAVFKLILSPHSPPTAYIAVFFQGLIGQILFSTKLYFTFLAVLLAVLALVESAIQRILVLIILYGNDFWQAVNGFIKKVTGDNTITNYSFTLAACYVLIHALAGIFVGFFAARIVNSSGHWRTTMPQYYIVEESYIHGPFISKTKRKKKKVRLVFLIAWLLLVGFYIQSFMDPAGAILPQGKVVNILIRSALVIFAWYLFVSPLIMAGIKKALLVRKARDKEDMDITMKLLPEIKMIFQKSWQFSVAEKGFKRLKLFLKILLMNILEVNR